MIVLCLNEVLYIIGEFPLKKKKIIIGELACFLFAGNRYGELVF